MRSINYDQGKTTVYVDEEKIVIDNPTGPKWVETNVDHIFGVGEFKKIQKVCYKETWNRKSNRKYHMTSGYIPDRALVDMGLKKESPMKIPEDQLPGTKASDIISEYFNADDNNT